MSAWVWVVEYDRWQCEGHYGLWLWRDGEYIAHVYADGNWWALDKNVRVLPDARGRAATVEESQTEALAWLWRREWINEWRRRQGR